MAVRASVSSVRRVKSAEMSMGVLGPWRAHLSASCEVMSSISGNMLRMFVGVKTGFSVRRTWPQVFWIVCAVKRPSGRTWARAPMEPMMCLVNSLRVQTSLTNTWLLMKMRSIPPRCSLKIGPYCSASAMKLWTVLLRSMTPRLPIRGQPAGPGIASIFKMRVVVMEYGFQTRRLQRLDHT